MEGKLKFHKKNILHTPDYLDFFLDSDFNSLIYK